MGLIIPAGTEAADIATIIANWNKLENTSGMILCTSSTRPTTNKFPGMYIKETDTGKHYYLDGTGSWAAGVYTGGAWIEDSYVTGLVMSGGQVFYPGQSLMPYILGKTGGVSGGAAIDVADGTTIDFATLTVPVAGATTRAVADITMESFICNNLGVPNFGRNYADSTDAGIKYELYDGVTNLGLVGLVTPELASRASDYEKCVKRTFALNLTVATHNLTVKGTLVNGTGQMGSSLSRFQGVVVGINVTLSS
jgi:hypothetical protein